MEGMLCWWALALQEYDFYIVYWKGEMNANADALSHRSSDPCAVTLVTQQTSLIDLNLAQQNDTVLSTLLEARGKSNKPPTGSDWNRLPFSQLWAQLEISEGILCHKYTPEPIHNSVSYPKVCNIKPLFNATIFHQLVIKEVRKHWNVFAQTFTGLL